MDTTMTDFEFHKKRYEHDIKMWEALQRLQANPDFKLLFDEYFFAKKLTEEVTALSNYQQPASVELANKRVFAIGFLNAWFKSLESAGLNAKDQLAEMYADQAKAGE